MIYRPVSVPLFRCSDLTFFYFKFLAFDYVKFGIIGIRVERWPGIMSEIVGRRQYCRFVCVGIVGAVLFVAANRQVSVNPSLGYDLYTSAHGSVNAALSWITIAILGSIFVIAALVGLILHAANGRADSTKLFKSLPVRIVAIVLTVLPILVLAVVFLQVPSLSQSSLSLLIGMYEFGLLFGLVPTYSIIAGAILGTAFS